MEGGSACYNDPRMTRSRRLAGVLLLLTAVLAPGTAMSVSDAAMRYFNEAEAALRKGDLATAKAKMAAGIKLEPQHANAMANLGNIYMMEGDFRTAALWLDRALKIDPKNAIGLNSRALCHLKTNEIEKAVELFLRSAEADPSNPTPITNLGDAAKLVGDLANAKKYYELALDAKADHERALVALAEIHADAGEGKKAFAYAQTAVKAHPQSWAARGALGKAYAANREWYKAIDSLYPASRAMPKNVAIAYALGVSLMNTRQFGPAIETFLGALEQVEGEGDPKLHLQLGVSYYMLGDPQHLPLAKTEFEHTLERNPAPADKASALYHLALMLDDAEKFPEALEGYRKVIAIDPVHTGANNNVGLILMKRGEHGKAIPFFQSSLKGSPGFPPAQFNLGVCLLQTGREKDGRAELEKLVKALPEEDPFREQATQILATGKPR